MSLGRGTDNLTGDRVDGSVGDSCRRISTLNSNSGLLQLSPFGLALAPQVGVLLVGSVPHLTTQPCGAAAVKPSTVRNSLAQIDTIITNGKNV